jgi:hypothetical protein
MGVLITEIPKPGAMVLVEVSSAPRFLPNGMPGAEDSDHPHLDAKLDLATRSEFGHSTHRITPQRVSELKKYNDSTMYPTELQR